MLEAMMGLNFDDRHGQEFYQQHLREEHKGVIAAVEQQPSLIQLTCQWLERMPFFDEVFWQSYSPVSTNVSIEHPFWCDYVAAYEQTLSDGDNHALTSFNDTFFNDKATNRKLTAKANRAALFIMTYRDYPILQIPFQFLDTLIAIDENMATWRSRHISMVKRMIGARIGTGGSSGAEYLKASRDKHLVFTELSDISSFLIQRNSLPHLSVDLQKKLGFTVTEHE